MRGRATTGRELAPGDPIATTTALASLHHEWRAAWGGTISGAALRAEMEANPRLHERMLKAIAARHGRAVTRAPRLDRLSTDVLAALADDREGFVRLCGLARIGRRVAMATNPADYAALARVFGKAALAAAARIAASLPHDDGGHGYDSEQLAPAADRMGMGVIEEWASTLPEPAADWIAMHMPRGEGEPATMGTARARTIVEGAVEAWPSIREAGDTRGDARGDTRTGRRRRAA